MVLVNYLFTIGLIVWIFLLKNPWYSFVPLFISGLSGIPVYYFGNSSSGGIFPADIIAITIFLRFGLNYGRTWIRITKQRKVFLPFLLLTLWATFSSIFALTHSEYGNKYFIFILYGIGRWWTFAFFVFLFLGYKFNKTDHFKILKNLFFTFFIIGLLILLHQSGLIEISGREGLGPRIIEATKNILDTYEMKTMFWGSNRASVGAICYTGFWLAILVWIYTKEYKWRRNALILAILMTICLIGSWSRSDFVGLLVSFTLFIIFSMKYQFVRVQKLGISIFFFVTLLLLLVMVFGINIKSTTIVRYLPLFNSEWMTEGTGRYRIIMHTSIINYVFKHPMILFTGLGANCFRTLYGQVGIWSNAAHNTFLHILVELGLIGELLTLFWIYRVIVFRIKILGDNKKRRFFTSKDIFSPILLFYIIGRLVSGYAADTLFAVDAMLPANIMLIGFIGLHISLKDSKSI